MRSTVHLYRSRHAFSCERYIVSKKPKITIGTSENVRIAGTCVAPAKLTNAPTRVRHHVLQGVLLLARRLIMPCSRFKCAITAGLSPDQKFLFSPALITSTLPPI